MVNVSHIKGRFESHVWRNNVLIAVCNGERHKENALEIVNALNKQAEMKFLLDEATKSMENAQGYRAGLYLRGAHQNIHGIEGDELTICRDKAGWPT